MLLSPAAIGRRRIHTHLIGAICGITSTALATRGEQRGSGPMIPVHFRRHEGCEVNGINYTIGFRERPRRLTLRKSMTMEASWGCGP